MEVYRQFKGEVSSNAFFYSQGGIDEDGKGQIFSHVRSFNINREAVFFLKKYNVLEKDYLMLSGSKAIVKYDDNGDYIRAYVSGYEYNDLLREVYKPIVNCTGCYNKKIKKKKMH